MSVMRESMRVAAVVALLMAVVVNAAQMPIEPFSYSQLQAFAPGKVEHSGSYRPFGFNADSSDSVNAPPGMAEAAFPFQQPGLPADFQNDVVRHRGSDYAQNARFREVMAQDQQRQMPMQQQQGYPAQPYQQQQYPAPYGAQPQPMPAQQQQAPPLPNNNAAQQFRYRQQNAYPNIPSTALHQQYAQQQQQQPVQRANAVATGVTPIPPRRAARVHTAEPRFRERLNTGHRGTDDLHLPSEDPDDQGEVVGEAKGTIPLDEVNDDDAEASDDGKASRLVPLNQASAKDLRFQKVRTHSKHKARAHSKAKSKSKTHHKRARTEDEDQQAADEEALKNPPPPPDKFGDKGDDKDGKDKDEKDDSRDDKKEDDDVTPVKDDKKEGGKGDEKEEDSKSDTKDSKGDKKDDDDEPPAAKDSSAGKSDGLPSLSVDKTMHPCVGGADDCVVKYPKDSVQWKTKTVAPGSIKPDQNELDKKLGLPAINTNGQMPQEPDYSKSPAVKKAQQQMYDTQKQLFKNKQWMTKVEAIVRDYMTKLKRVKADSVRKVQEIKQEQQNIQNLMKKERADHLEKQLKTALESMNKLNSYSEHLNKKMSVLSKTKMGLESTVNKIKSVLGRTIVNGGNQGNTNGGQVVFPRFEQKLPSPATHEEKTAANNQAQNFMGQLMRFLQTNQGAQQGQAMNIQTTDKTVVLNQAGQKQQAQQKAQSKVALGETLATQGLEANTDVMKQASKIADFGNTAFKIRKQLSNKYHKDPSPEVVKALATADVTTRHLADAQKVRDRMDEDRLHQLMKKYD